MIHADENALGTGVLRTGAEDGGCASLQGVCMPSASRLTADLEHAPDRPGHAGLPNP